MKLCDEIRELLSEYMDNMLDPKKRLKVQKHLSQCPACKTELDKLVSLSEGVKRLEKVEAPADFAKRVRARIDDRRGLNVFLKNLFKNEDIKVPVMLLATVIVVITVAKMTDIYYQTGLYEQDALKRAVSIEQRKADIVDHMITTDGGMGASYTEKAPTEAVLASTATYDRTDNGAKMEMQDAVMLGYNPDMKIAAKSSRQAIGGAYYIIVETRTTIDKAQSKIRLLLKRLNIKIVYFVKTGGTITINITLPHQGTSVLIDGLKELNIGHIAVPVGLPSQGEPGQEELAVSLQVKKI